MVHFTAAVYRRIGQSRRGPQSLHKGVYVTGLVQTKTGINMLPAIVRTSQLRILWEHLEFGLVSEKTASLQYFDGVA